MPAYTDFCEYLVDNHIDCEDPVQKDFIIFVWRNTTGKSKEEFYIRLKEAQEAKNAKS